MVGLKAPQLFFNQNESADDDIKDVTEEESEDEEIMLAEPTKSRVFNKGGLFEKIDDVRWPENLDWMHKLSIDIDQEQNIDVNDDLTRELAFYTQALKGSCQAFEKFQSMRLPFLRPADYYAEMVKSDSHMMKIKGRLLEEKKRIEEADERRKARESKRIAKEVQAQKLKERAKQKREEIESVKKWRKQRQQSRFKGGNAEDMDLDFEEGFQKTKKLRPGVSPGDRSGGKARLGIKKGIDKKRKNRDLKLGYGGRKGLKKQNTAQTTDDLRGFNKGDVRGAKKGKNR